MVKGLKNTCKQKENSILKINPKGIHGTVLSNTYPSSSIVLHRCVPEALADLLDTAGSLVDNIDKMENKTTLTDRNNQTLTESDLEESFE